MTRTEGKWSNCQSVEISTHEASDARSRSVEESAKRKPAVSNLDWCLVSHPSVGVSVHGEPQEEFRNCLPSYCPGHTAVQYFNILSGSTFSQTVFFFSQPPPFRLKKRKKKETPGNFHLIFDNALICEVEQSIKQANSTRTHLTVIKAYIREAWTSTNTWTNCSHCRTLSSVSAVLFLVCLWSSSVILDLMSPSIRQSGACVRLSYWVFHTTSSLSLLTERRDGKLAYHCSAPEGRCIPTASGSRVLGIVP